MALVLHAENTDKNAHKTLIAAEYTGVKVSLAQNFEMGVSNKTPEFLKMNPIGKVPVLETPEGPIFESNAIARHVARLKENNPLFGFSPTENSLVDQWIDFSSLEIDINILRWYYPRIGFTVYLLHPDEEAAIAALRRGLAALNTHLASKAYLVGHSVTLADIIMTCNLTVGFSKVMTKSFTSEFPHVERYFWTMVNHPNFSKVLGEVKQTDSIPSVQSVKKPTPKGSAKLMKEEEPKPKKETPMEEEETPKPKPKNPLDLLPASPMIFDDWKRLYSNTKTDPIPPVPKFSYIFCDMDGTLLNSKYQITSTTAGALREAMSRGVQIVIATGKARPAVINALKAVDLAGKDGIVSEFSPGVFLQGLLVYGRQGQEIFRGNLDSNVCREAFIYSWEAKVPLVAFGQDRCFTLLKHPLIDSLHMVYHEPKAEVMSSVDHLIGTADIQKLLFLDTAESICTTLRPYWSEATKGRAAVVQAMPDMLEIVPSGTSKGSGVKMLLEHFGVSPNEVMAIGDGENDIEMLELVSLGVALSNGVEKTKAVANVIGASNDEDGVAEAIYRYAF